MPTDNGDEDLSPEEKEVERILQEASKRIEEIEFWKSNLPPLSGPVPHPSGMPFEGWTQAKRELLKRNLDYRKELVIADAKDQAVKALENSSLDTQLKGYNRVDDWAEPKVDRQKNIEERTANAKDVSKSQDVSMLKLHDSKEKNKVRKTLSTPTEASKAVEEKKPSTQPSSFAERYNISLRFNSKQEIDNISLEKSDIEPNRDS